MRTHGSRTLRGGLAALSLLAAAHASAQTVNYLPGQNGAPNGGQVNGAGATLFAPFFNGPQGTNDFINADGDWVDCNTNGILDSGERLRAGFYDSSCPPDGIPDAVDQLAPVFQCPTWTGYWLFQYRAVGSVEGFGEFVDYQLLGRFSTVVPSDRGLINQRQYATTGSQQNIGCAVADCNTDGIFPGNESGTPVCMESVDFANTDVPTDWVIRAGAPANRGWDRKPLQNGYGDCNKPSTTGLLSLLESLERDSDGAGPNPPISLNTNTNAPDSRTVFDTIIAWSPVVAIANPGTGRENIRYTELQHLMVTGRMPNGENLVGQCRDVGSGTRNTFANGINVDPAWCNGDNVGNRINNALFANLGPECQPTHCGGSGISEAAVQNWRLSIGFNGLALAGRSAADAQAGLYEVLNVCKDIDGDGNGQPDSDCTASPCHAPFGGGCSRPLLPGVVPAEAAVANDGYVRPTISSVLDNDDPRCGYQIGAAQTLSTVGDPESGFDGNTNPAVMNVNARNFIRNITESVAAFNGDVNTTSVNNMPGEQLADTTFLISSVDGVPFGNNPTDLRPNGALFNQLAQDYSRCFNGLGIGQDTPAYGATSVAGRVPQRRATGTPVGFTVTYTDGSTNGRYVDSGGAFNLSTSARLNHRNLISGDFNYDGQRDWADAEELVKALCQPRRYQKTEIDNPPAAPGWARSDAGIPSGYTGGLGSNFVVPEILGDFNGDGNFNAEDARYWADGLALNPATRVLNRAEGFRRLDVAWRDFRPTIPTTSPTGFPAAQVCTTTVPCWHPTLPGYLPAWPAAPALGAAVADVAGATPTVGFKPSGFDGRVDGKDIDYIQRNFGNFANLRYEAVNMDLTCDMDGNLVVNQADVDYVVRTVLGTQYGDANLDGRVDMTDEAIVTNSINNGCGGGACGWADGDFTGDGIVNANDLGLLAQYIGFCSPYICTVCPQADIDANNTRDAADVALFISALLDNASVTPGQRARADNNSDGAVDGDDMQSFVNCYLQP